MIVFGYLVIPRMKIKLPLYIGAGKRASCQRCFDPVAIVYTDKLRYTNSMIAAHQGGYAGASMFHDIEKLKINDAIHITNPWYT